MVKATKKGRAILRNAAKYLVKSRHFGYHVHPHEEPEYYFSDSDAVDLVTAEERPTFDALHILACLSRGRDLTFVNVSRTVAWLLDEAESLNVGVKSANV